MSADIYLSNGIQEAAQQNEVAARGRIRTAITIGAISAAAFFGGQTINADPASAQTPGCALEQTADGYIETCENSVVTINGGGQETASEPAPAGPAQEAAPDPEPEQRVTKKKRVSSPIGGIAVYKNFGISRSGKLPYTYNMGDKPWGNDYWPTAPGTPRKSNATSSCGVTGYGRILSAYKGRRITPPKVRRENEWAVQVGGSAHEIALVAGRRDGFKTKRYGDVGDPINAREMRKVEKALKNGALALALARYGRFTKGAGHFVDLSYDHNKNDVRVTETISKRRKYDGTYSNKWLITEGSNKGSIEQITLVAPKGVSLK